WLVETVARSRAADQAIAAGDLAGGRNALERVTQTAPPESIAAPDREAVLQDTYYRLARIELRSHDPKKAGEWALRGLALGDRETLFAANLHIVRGEALEQQSDARGAAREYERAQRIDETLLHQEIK